MNSRSVIIICARGNVVLTFELDRLIYNAVRDVADLNGSRVVRLRSE